MNYFIYTYIISLLTGRYELNKLTSLPMCGFIAQLIKHRTIGNAPISVKPEGGGGLGIGWGFWHFLKKIIKIPTPGQKRIVKISRNKWFTSLLLHKIERSNAWCPIKIPTLGIYATVKFPWVARPPPPLLELDTDRCITQAHCVWHVT